MCRGADIWAFILFIFDLANMHWPPARVGYNNVHRWCQLILQRLPLPDWLSPGSPPPPLSGSLPSMSTRSARLRLVALILNVD